MQDEPENSSWGIPNRPAWYEPREFKAPTFEVRNVALYHSAGEPTVAVDPEGNILVHAPGCLHNVTCLPGQHSDAALVESRDEGRTWFAHNRATDGWIADRPAQAPEMASQEAHIAVSPNGTRFLFSMGYPPETETAGASVSSGASYGRLFRSDGPNASWEYLRDVYDPDGTFDRPWVSAGGNGMVILAWNGGGNPILFSQDDGDTWSNFRSCPCGLTSPPAFAPTGPLAYLGVYVNPTDPPATDVPGLAMNTGTGAMQTLDGGATWTKKATPYIHQRPVASTALINGAILPSAAVTGDGTLVLAWAQFDGDPTGYGVILGTSVWATVSSDGGTTWQPAIRISSRANAIMPWVVPGGGDRFAVAYYTTDTPGEPSRAYTAIWDVAVATALHPYGPATKVSETVAAPSVHSGSICTSGTGCAASDRYTVLDFLTATTLNDGRIVVSYAADNPDDLPTEPALKVAGFSRNGVIRLAVQTGGTPLFLG